MIAATTSEQELLDHAASEINSISFDDSTADVAYKPDAVTHEGKVD